MTSSTTTSTLTGMASNTTEKVRENRLRRMAERQGFRLEKSRRRDPRAIGYGTYRIVLPNPTSTDTLMFPQDSPGADLDAIEAWLTGEWEGLGLLSDEGAK